MSNLINFLKAKKKYILIISFILLLPFIITLIDIIFNLGRCFGTLIRYIVENLLIF